MEVKLRRDGWHFRLQKWVFGEVPYQNNFCPYFWLTIFCLVASPFKLAWLGVYAAFLRPLFKLFDWIDDHVCTPLMTHVYTRIPAVDIYPIFYAHQKWDEYSLPKKKRRLFKLWMKYVPNARQRLEDAREAYMAKKRHEDLEWHRRQCMQRDRRARLEARSKAVYQALIKYTKWLVYVVGAAVAVGVTLGLWYAGCWLTAHVKGAAVLAALKYLGGLFAVVGVLFFVFFAVRKAFRCLQSLVRIPRVRMPSFLISAWEGVESFVGFFVVFFANFKKDHCPTIEWEK